jgi:hypothetical protein
VDFPKTETIGDVAFAFTSLESANFPKATNFGDSVFGSNKTATLVITMGMTAPTVGENMFEHVNASKTVTVKVPQGAIGYDTDWQSDFKGGNNNINLEIEEL